MHKTLRFILLSLALLALPWVAFAQDAVAIEIGDTVAGDLTVANDTDIYTFEAEADQIVTITLISDSEDNSFDTFLTLQDAEGNELATDDDSAGGLDSQITGFTITEAGTYTILVQSYDSSQGNPGQPGDYELTVEEAQGTTVEYGMSVDGELTTAEPRVYYNFTGTEGDTILITMIAEDGWDTYLNLYQGTEAGSVITYDDDSAGNYNSLIGPFTLPASGLYTIEATSFGQNSGSGSAETEFANGGRSYTLSLERAELTLLNYGDAVEGTFTESQQFLYYQFEGNVGDIIDLTVQDGAAIGTSLVVNSPDGFQVTYADSYSGADPTVNDFQLTQDGVYTILIRTLEAGSAGKITVVFDEAVLASLDEEAQTLEFSDTVTRNSLVFTGEAGETVTINVSADSGSTVSPNITITQDGTSVTYISASVVSAMSVSFEVPSDGVVLVQIDEYSYSRNRLDVELVRAAE